MDMELRGTGELLGADQSGFVSRVGFELFSSMLEEATAELRGEPYITEVDPELSIDVEALLPESFIADVGVRLSLYKKYAQAHDEAVIQRLNEEVEDRFGRAPECARRFFEVMRLKTDLRRLRALGLSANERVATLHLREDTPLRGEILVPFVLSSGGKYTLSPDGRLTRRAPSNMPERDGISHADRMLSDLSQLFA
jgi:transcription-repair coupling factor (superfamily II helicase)